MIDHAVAGGFLRDAKLGIEEEEVQVSHVVFADNTLIFCDAS